MLHEYGLTPEESDALRKPAPAFRQLLHEQHAGFEIRTFLAISGATEDATGEIRYYYRAILHFAVACTIGVMKLGDAKGLRSAA